MANETQNQLGDEVYSVELAYAETPKRSAVKTFSLANVATLEVNASRNTFSTTIDVSENICSLPIPLSLVCSKDENFFRLSVDETMRECDLDDNSKGYVYTNSKGENFVFKELFYKVSDSGDKYYVNKQRSDITLKDGALYDEEDGKQVFIEYRQKDGWTVVPKIEGFKGIELIDTREKEEKQYAEQSQYYADILDNYVTVAKKDETTQSTSQVGIINEYSHDKSETDTQIFLEGVNDDKLLLQKSEALSYESICSNLSALKKEKEQNHDRKSLLQKELSCIEKSIEDFRTGSSYHKTDYTEIMDEHWSIDGWTPNSDPDAEGTKTPWDEFTQGGTVIDGSEESSTLPEEKAKSFTRIRNASSTNDPTDIYVCSFLQYLDLDSNRYTDVADFYKEARFYFEQDFDNNTEMIVPRDEANRYASLLLQKSTYENEIAKLGDSDYSTENDAQVDGEATKVLKDRISALELQKEYLEAKAGTTLEELEKCRKEYATAKLNYDTYISTKTEFAITNGTIIKAFNKNGKFVSILGGQDEVKVSYSPNNGKISELSDESGNYISFTYYEDMGENILLKSISTSLGKNLHFSYLQSIENGIIDTISLSSNDIDIATIVYNSDKKVASITSNIENVREEFTYENGEIKSVKQIFINAESGIESDVRQLYFAEESIDPYRHYFAINYDLKESEFWDVDYTGRVLRHFVEGQHGKLKEYQEYEYVPYWHRTNPNDNPCDVISVANKQGLLDINAFSEEVQTIKGSNVSYALNTFNNPIIEEVTGEDLTNKGIQKIVTNFTYDDMQNVVKKTETVTLIDSTISHVTYTIYEYANSVLVKELSYVEGEESTYGKNVTEYEYSEDGGVKKVSYNTLQSSDKIYEESIYDKKGLKLCDFDVTGKHKIEYAYNKDNSLREISLPNGTKFAYGYDSYGNVTSISQSTIDGVENSTDRTYSGGKIVELRSGNTTLGYEYDNKRRVTSVSLNGIDNYCTTSYGDNESIYSIDDTDFSNPITVDVVSTTTLGVGTKTSFTDKTGKLIQENSDIDIVCYTYYDNDLLKNVKTGANETLEEYEYNDKNNLTKYKKGLFVETNTYAPTGELIQTVTGKLTESETEGVTQTLTDTLTYDYTYSNDSRRQLESITVSGETFKPKKDALGRNIGKEIYNGNTMVARTKMNYVKHGDHTTNLPSTIQYMNGSGGIMYTVSKTLKYSYDNMGNISAIYDNGKLKCRYEYDALNRLTREDNKLFGKTWTYFYDDNGNIIEKRTYSYTLCDTSDLEEKSYTYDENLYSTVGDRVERVNGYFVTYDNIGRVSQYKLMDCTWNRGKLVGLGSNSFAYDYKGRRISKNGITFTYDSQGRLVEQSNGIKFIYDDTGVAGMIQGGSLYLYEKDAQGNIISLLDSLGFVVVRYEYDAWGVCKVYDANGNVITQHDSVDDNPFRYRGYYYDVETGLYYLPARYYDPTTGRFISADDREYADPETINGLNLYAYCGNNPVMNVDPSGHFVLTATMIWAAIGIGAAIGAGIGLGATVAKDLENGKLFDGDVTFLSYLGNILGGGIAGAGIGLCSVLGAGLGIALSTGTALSIGGTAISGGVALAMGVSGAFVSGGLGYTLRTAISDQEEFEWSDMFIEAGANAISGILTFAGSMVGGILGIKTVGKTGLSFGQKIKNFLLFNLGQLFFGIYPLKFMTSYIKNSLKEIIN